MTNILIQRYYYILIVLDTDIILADSDTTKPSFKSGPSLNEKLGILTEEVETLINDLTEINTR